MKRSIIVIGILIFALQQISAQVPQTFSYQAVLRNADGTVMAAQDVSIRIKLHKVSASGDVVYTETNSVTTNGQGLVNLSIGGGDAPSFATVPWSDNIFIQVEVKKPSDGDYASLGTAQILSVPYALNAGSVKEVKSQSSAEDAIFEVKNSNGDVVFGVYQGGVRMYVKDAATTKGSKGGFAVGGLTGKGVTDGNMLFVDSDSTRINFTENSGKGSKGGFAVGGLSGKNKSASDNYFKVTTDSTYFSTTVLTSADIVTSGTISYGGTVTYDPNLFTSTVKDIDGNVYNVIQIGSQVWMQENLRTTHYTDNSSIDPQSMADYNNLSNADSIKAFGYLYSGYVVYYNSNMICPEGWRVPTYSDWDSLFVHCGGQLWLNDPTITGLKLMDPSYWSNVTANNETGFSARPGGQATPPWSTFPWSFMGKGSMGSWWGIQMPLMGVMMDGFSGAVNVLPNINYYGGSPSDNAFSIRCVKGLPIAALPFKK
jgi:uncharacterized protein (TIGR02145 family)